MSAMKIGALESSSDGTPARKHHTADVHAVPFSPWFIQPASPLDGTMIQRKSCACGGGCPGCREEPEELEDLHLQTKLAISTPGDPFEQEADRVAERVMRMPAPPVQGPYTAPVAGGLPDNFLSGLGSGAPLDPATRSYFEPRLGADFGTVRVHTDGEAAASARAIGARAYTVAGRVVFGTGEYRPQTDEGKRLLAHELTHVVQQRGDTPGSARIQRACGPAAIGAPAGCTPVSGEILGERFLFALNCDDFLVPGEQARLELFAGTIAQGETIAIHGYASIDGGAAFNESLSCARALRAQFVIQSILKRKGVSANVGVFMHGANPGPHPAEQRSVVIDRSGVAPTAPPTTAPSPPVSAPPPSVTTSPTTASTGATVSGCTTGPTGQEGAIRSAISSAITTWLPAAIKALGASPLAPDTTALLDKHFKTHAPADVSVILDNFKKIQSSVDASSTAYECANWNPLCAVGSAFTYCSSNTTHICSDAFDYGTMQLTRLVIHERGHGVGLCKDIYCDLHEAEYKKLSSTDAMNNADTYATFAGEISGKFLC